MVIGSRARAALLSLTVPIGACGGAAVHDDAGHDGAAMDSGLPACADAFMSYRYRVEDGPERSGCLPLMGSLSTAFISADCVFADLEGWADPSSSAEVGMLGVAMGGRPWESIGPVTDWTSIRCGLIEESSCPAPDGCVFSANEPPHCSFVITRAGGPGDVIEAQLAEPCTLPGALAPVLPPPATITPRMAVFDAFVVRGPLVVRYETDASVPGCDAGADGGI